MTKEKKKIEHRAANKGVDEERVWKGVKDGDGQVDE